MKIAALLFLAAALCATDASIHLNGKQYLVRYTVHDAPDDYLRPSVRAPRAKGVPRQEEAQVYVFEEGTEHCLGLSPDGAITDNGKPCDSRLIGKPFPVYPCKTLHCEQDDKAEWVKMALRREKPAGGPQK